MGTMDDDRFGMPQSAFDAAWSSHGLNNPMFRAGMHVPTRREVATMPPDPLAEILDHWLWESPTELIPSHSQVADVPSVLLSRPDAGLPEIRALVAECDDYLTPYTG